MAIPLLLLTTLCSLKSRDTTTHQDKSNSTAILIFFCYPNCPVVMVFRFGKIIKSVRTHKQHPLHHCFYRIFLFFWRIISNVFFFFGIHVDFCSVSSLESEPTRLFQHAINLVLIIQLQRFDGFVAINAVAIQKESKRRGLDTLSCSVRVKNLAHFRSFLHLEKGFVTGLSMKIVLQDAEFCEYLLVCNSAAESSSESLRCGAKWARHWISLLRSNTCSNPQQRAYLILDTESDLFSFGGFSFFGHGECGKGMELENKKCFRFDCESSNEWDGWERAVAASLRFSRLFFTWQFSTDPICHGPHNHWNTDHNPIWHFSENATSPCRNPSMQYIESIGKSHFHRSTCCPLTNCLGFHTHIAPFLGPHYFCASC